jgi:hypothetical protein
MENAIYLTALSEYKNINNMAKVTTIQTFVSIADIKEQYGMTLPKPFEWRLLAIPFVGAVNGIPTSHGVAVATNGILVAIVQDERRLFIGHIDSFVADTQENEVRLTVRQAVKPRKEKKPTMDISEFV